ncbi:hypothetical protein Tco_0873357 [Tanacetum coccineum]
MGKGLLGPNGGSGRTIEGRFGEHCGGNGGIGGSKFGVSEGKEFKRTGAEDPRQKLKERRVKLEESSSKTMLPIEGNLDLKWSTCTRGSFYQLALIAFSDLRKEEITKRLALKLVLKIFDDLKSKYDN